MNYNILQTPTSNIIEAVTSENQLDKEEKHLERQYGKLSRDYFRMTCGLTLALFFIISCMSERLEASPGTGSNAGGEQVSSPSNTTPMGVSRSKSNGVRFKYPLKSEAGNKPLKPPVTYQGIFYKATKVSKPLNLINPFADKSYGYGRGMVSWDKSQGKPKGFIAYGVRFW